MPDFDNRQEPRPKFDISDLNIKCAECGTDIKELPFQPTKKDDGTYGRIYCYECNRNRRRSFGGGGSGGRPGFRR